MKNGDHTDQKCILTNSFKWKIGLILKYHIHVLYTLKQQNANLKVFVFLKLEANPQN